MDLDYWGDLAQKAFVNGFPSTNWANKIVEPWKGLPFGPNLHAARPRRPRALTGPVEVPPESLWSSLHVFSPEPVQQTDEQVSSALFSKFPLDIRMIIYELALGNMVFHLEAKNSAPYIVMDICHRPDQLDESSHQCHDPKSGSSSPMLRGSTRDVSGLLPLLMTCRRVYSEVIPILYGTNIFEFRQGKGAFYFLRCMLPPQRLRNIRNFRLHMRLPHHPSLNNRSRRDWKAMCDFFTNEMTGLQHLYLRLLTNYIVETRIKETDDADGADWTQPIMLMAVDAHQRRGCKVKLVTPGVSGGVAHDCIKIFNETMQTTSESSQERVVELASIALHERIRLALEG